MIIPSAIYRALSGVKPHQEMRMTKQETVARRGRMTAPGAPSGSGFKPKTLWAQTKEKVLRKCACKDVRDVTVLKLRRNTLYH